MFDKKKFKAAAALVGKSMKEVADILEIDSATLCRKMNGTSDFYRAEIDVLCRKLGISNVDEIFFAQNIT